MAGHSKWANIKHKKAAKDAKRGKIFTRHAKNIQVESRLAGGDVNSPGLRTAIEAAKKDNVPKENIERAVAKGSGVGGEVLERITYEAYGPGGVAIVIETLTDSRNRTAAEIRHLLSKNGVELANPGAATWAFTKQGTEWIPQTTVDISDTEMEKLEALVEAIEDHDDVQQVFVNLE